MKFIHMKSYIYGHIHPCKCNKITLNFKLQVQSSKLRLHAHAQAIFMLVVATTMKIMKFVELIGVIET